MHKSDTPEDAFSPNPYQPLFPPPPESPADIRIRLKSIAQVSAQGYSGTVTQHVGLIGAFGDDASDASRPSKQVAQPVWLPEEEGGDQDAKGRWKREVRFDSTIFLNCAPTFWMDIVDCRVRTPFPYTTLKRRG
jgi:hypothetical protein